VANFGSKSLFALVYTLCNVLGIFSAAIIYITSYTEWGKKVEHNMLYIDIGLCHLLTTIKIADPVTVDPENWFC